MADAAARRIALRSTFDRIAERYDRVRPRYPAPLFDDLEALGGLRRGSRVLEVGCGTGQATVDLARRGHAVTALELGVDLAAVARRRLASHRNVELVVADFETWQPPSEPFDAVLFATSFHWLDPATRVRRATALLRPGGAVATIRTHHVAGGSGSFFVDVQDCYERWDPETEADLRLPRAADVPVDSEGLDAAGAFERIDVRRHEWEQAYARDAYLELLSTYSGHLAMDRDARRGLLGCVGRLIDERYGGWVVKRYLFELFVARLPATGQAPAPDEAGPSAGPSGP